MKKKSLSAKKIIHKKLIKNLKNNRINKVFKIFKNNLGFIKTNNIAVAVSGGPDSLALSYLVKCLVINNKKKSFFLFSRSQNKEKFFYWKQIYKTIVKKLWYQMQNFNLER